MDSCIYDFVYIIYVEVESAERINKLKQKIAHLKTLNKLTHLGGKEVVQIYTWVAWMGTHH